MKYFANFFNRKKVVVMIAYGGVGEFLFQLDLARRFEFEKFEVLFLVKNKYTFFSDILREANTRTICLINASRWRYVIGMGYVFYLSLRHDVTIVNSFNSLFYRLPTMLFYNIARLCSARIVISKHKVETSLTFEQVPYTEEMIWERNVRIVEHVCMTTNTRDTFPVIDFTSKPIANTSLSSYIHIHPVGSSFKKSYPSKKLLEVLRRLVDTNQILITMTPNEETWYMTDELRNFIMEHKDRVILESRFFSAKEIISYIKNSKVFCTVNTGLLWFSILLGHRTIVFDTFTDYEWNPSPYKDVTRLAHDYDERGMSLHLVTKEHEDGVYFESMYLITVNEVCEAIFDSIKNLE